MSVRGRELANLVLVGLLTAAGFAAVYMARQEVVSTASLSYAAFFVGLFVVAHVVLRLRLPNADPYLLPLGGLLCAIGLTEIYRIEPDLAFRQGFWVVIGVAAFSALVLFLRDYRALDNVKYLLGLTAIGLLVLPALPFIGRTVNGATLWVELGPVFFQPGEIAKVLIVVFLAGYLRDNREMLSYGTGAGRLPSPKHLGPLLLIWGGAMLVLFQTRDLGGALLYFAIFLVMLYTATARWSFVAVGLGLFLLGAYALYQVIPHVQTRVEGWIDPWSDPEGTTYQLAQSLYAISSGGIFGSGLGRGVLLTPEGETYIPFLETDFIYSAVAHELGLAGAAAVILLYLVFAYRGFRIAMLADDGFSKLLAAGLTAAVAIQAFIIIGGVSGLIPLTGITLPFVSYGGSSIVANFVVLALLLMVSDRAGTERSGT
ncbi:MAG TPA: FtsW/RodA/SpoVE family cell cycle protein [Gaiellaceae bacterium]|nr:FtsW/RodA/SpoVE family cell cycle protein [Gaiellaceae bacterium]